MKKIKNSLFSLILLLVFLSCESIGVPKEEDLKESLSWNLTEFEKIIQNEDSTLPEMGWVDQWNIPELSQSILLGFEKNQNLESMLKSIDTQRALQKQISSGLYPQINLNAGGGGGWNTLEKGNGFPSVGLGVNWEADLWGKIRNAIEAQNQEVLSSEYLYAYAQESLASQIAISWLQLQEIFALQIKINEQLMIAEEFYDYINNQYDIGKTSKQNKDIALAQYLMIKSKSISTTRLLELQAVSLNQSIGTYENEASLIEDFSLSLSTVNNVPFSYLEKRFDIVASEANVLSAAYDKRAADLLKFPSLQISLNAGASAVYNFIATLQAGLFQPIYQGGAINAEIELQQALLDKSLADYRAKIIDAVGEVKKGQIQDNFLQEESLQIQEGVVAYQNAYLGKKEEFLIGKIDIENLLSIQNSWLATEEKLIQTRFKRYKKRVEFNKDLGLKPFSIKN